MRITRTTEIDDGKGRRVSVIESPNGVHLAAFVAPHKRAVLTCTAPTLRCACRMAEATLLVAVECGLVGCES